MNTLCSSVNLGWNEQRKSMSGRVSGTKAEIRTRSGSGLLAADCQNFSICSGLFEGICQLLAKRSIGQHFWEISHQEDLALIEWMAQLMWNNEPSLISGLSHSIGSGNSDRVSRTFYLTCPGWVFVSTPSVNMENVADNCILKKNDLGKSAKHDYVERWEVKTENQS